MGDSNFPYPHDTDPDIFREALSYSEAITGFTTTLIEKDYYCSVVLKVLFNVETHLIFRGGTCLSKVYADFYRLSEDLDLVIPVAIDASQSQRRAKMEPVKCIFNDLPAVVPAISISQAFKGHNNSRQYIGYFEYRSATIDKVEKIRIEVGIREPLLDPPVSATAKTIVLNPFVDQPLLPTFTVNAMAMKEAYTEKLRAALTRREPAVRDFFDLFYAVHKMGLDFHDPDLLGMLKEKLKVPGNDPVDVSTERKQELKKQMVGQLKPVLRPRDFEIFRLDETFELARNIAQTISA